MYSIYFVCKDNKPEHLCDLVSHATYEQAERFATSAKKDLISFGLLEEAHTWIVINNELTTIDEAIVG